MQSPWSPASGTHGNELIFRGIDGRECEAFVRAVKRDAYAQGKLGDSHWVAQYASLAFSGAALRWLATLDVDIANNWALLQQALLENYPPESEEPRSAGTAIPTPAAAPPSTPVAMPAPSYVQLPSPAPPTGQTFLSLRTTSWTGRIKVVSDDPTVPDSYLSRTPDAKIGVLLTCATAAEALIVEFTPSSYPHAIFIPAAAATSCPWLGAGSRSDRKLGSDIANWYAAPTATGSPSSYPVQTLFTHPKGDGPSKCVMWSISLDGTLQAIWESSSGNVYNLVCVVNIAYRRVYLVQNYKGFLGKDASSYRRARLLFDAI